MTDLRCVYLERIESFLQGCWEREEEDEERKVGVYRKDKSDTVLIKRKFDYIKVILYK